MPRALIEAFDERVGAEMIQGWGMTETSPLAAFGRPPAGAPAPSEIDYRVKAGRIVPGVEVRVVGEDGSMLPNDGESVGEFEIRGPWVTGSYYKDDDPSRFHDGWLRTGDVGSLDGLGYMTISDRTKDVIKSGGEWISSVELEGLVMAHPDVFEAAVIAVPDDRWDERPLVCVVPSEGASPPAAELSGLPGRQGGPVGDARAVGLRRRGAQDLGRQVRQEGAAGPLRGGRARRGHARPPARLSGDEQLAELAGRIRALAEELADLALDRLYDATERAGDPAERSAEERRLTRAARALEKAAADLEAVSGAAAE